MNNTTKNAARYDPTDKKLGETTIMIASASKPPITPPATRSIILRKVPPYVGSPAMTAVHTITLSSLLCDATPTTYPNVAASPSFAEQRISGRSTAPDPVASDFLSLENASP